MTTFVMYKKLSIKDPLNKLRSLAKTKYFPIEIDGEEIYLNETNESPKLILLRRKKEEINNQRYELHELLEEKKINKEEYKEQSDILLKEMKIINLKIQECKDEETKRVDLGHLLGSGGCKKFYEIKDGKALMLPNVDVDVISSSEWSRIIQEEDCISKKLSEYGLLCQLYEIVSVGIDGENLTSLKTNSFNNLIKMGVEVRDFKNRIHFGDSFLFGNYENLNNPDYLNYLLKDIKLDIITLLNQQINLDGASFNLAIQPKDEVDPHGDPTAFNKKVRLFFYDFSKKDSSIPDAFSLSLVDENGLIDEKQIAKNAERYLNLALASLMGAISNEELGEIKKTIPLDVMAGGSLISRVDKAIYSTFEEIKEDLLTEIKREVIQHFGEEQSLAIR